MSINTKQTVKNVIARSYLNKDRDAFKSTLLQHAQTFFPDKIKDFSEASLGGLLLDFAAEVGDHMSFYLDHQFTELDPELAVEDQNVQRHLVNAGVAITGASAAVVAVAWVIEVPAERSGASFIPSPSSLPVILQGSIVESDDGVLFELTEDLDFSATDASGKLLAVITSGQVGSDGNPATFILMMGGPGNSPRAPDGLCVSGLRAVETFVVPNSFVPFRRISLSNEDVTSIISVTDSDGNVYYEVSSLVQDTVFRALPNASSDRDEVSDSLELIPAPYRFETLTDIDTRLTTLRFGSGNAQTLNDDVIPDPSELALPLYGKQTFSRFSLDPGKLLGTQTLGVSPVNTTLTVTYRYGGGLTHNVASQTINTVNTLRMVFPSATSTTLSQQIRASLSVRNITPAVGGEDEPTIDDLRSQIPAARNAQSRIVTRPDLLARIYTMPSSLGRVFRAGIRSNPNNPLAAQLFIVSRDVNGNLTVSPDTLKKNLRIFLNEFRLISDAIDILDCPIVNFGLEFKVSTDPGAVKNLVLQNIISSLTQYFSISNFQIDQPISVDDVRNIIYNSFGVVSIVDLRFKNFVSSYAGRTYSNFKFDVTSNTIKQLIVGPPGSIFEMRYPTFDIVGSAV